MSNDLPLITRASYFAIASHAAIGQRRKYTGEPYSVHPIAVARLVFDTTRSEIATAAAFLHDVLEDTQVDSATLQEEFGVAVRRLVLEVTDVSRPEHGNRAVRKAIDRDHLARASALGQTIKVADLIDNTSSITAHDHDFARVYMAEKRLLLEVLTKADAGLLDRAWGLVRGYEDDQLQKALAR